MVLRNKCVLNMGHERVGRHLTKQVHIFKNFGLVALGCHGKNENK